MRKTALLFLPLLLLGAGCWIQYEPVEVASDKILQTICENNSGHDIKIYHCDDIYKTSDSEWLSKEDYDRGKKSGIAWADTTTSFYDNTGQRIISCGGMIIPSYIKQQQCKELLQKVSCEVVLETCYSLE